LFIKRTKRTLRGKTYTNHLLVEPVATERAHATGSFVRSVLSLQVPERSGLNLPTIYRVLRIPDRILSPIKQWIENSQ